ncbi:MAG: 5-oxoprolinase subunit PxpB [Pyrinomonadaceae bacterium]|nr:5-oxoprolinase subunit PxpB [Pyrinomonadaceae bacterium]
MTFDGVKISPLGDSALTLSFGNEISRELNDKVLELDILLNSDPFPGFIESVPAYSSLSVYYDALNVKRTRSDFETAFESVAAFIKELLKTGKRKIQKNSREVVVPVDFNLNFALDLDLAAEKRGFSIDEFKKIFTSTVYRVYFLGFLPGFAYMGEVDERISLDRRPVPRKNVPAGSVAIAGKQAGIYPLESPGGWNIIGRTDLRLFDPESDIPVFFRPGDAVRFVEKI